MPTDAWTRSCLLTIALSLAAIALRPMLPEARAADVMKCEITGGRFQIDSFGEKLSVKVEPVYGAPGSGQSNPLYVQVGD